MDTAQTPRRPRLRRWLIALAVVLLLLVAYATALEWFAQRIGTDVQRTMHAATSGQEGKRRTH
ncbi:MAG: hypothetical protein ABJA62_09955 [Luteimonas sp.]